MSDDNEIIETTIELLKNATPIILLASISLAIGAIVTTRQNEYHTILNYSIISSFLFIFAFIFYILYKLYKKLIDWWTRRLESKPNSPKLNSNDNYTINLFQYAPLSFIFLGLIYLILIVYQFGIQPNPNLEEINEPVVFFPWIGFYFTSYFIIYTSYYWIKKARAQRKNNMKKFVSTLLGMSILWGIFIPTDIRFLMEATEQPAILELGTILKYTIFALSLYGFGIMITDHVSTFRKHKVTSVRIISLTVVIGFSLIMIYAFPSYLQTMNFVDKKFDLYGTIFEEAKKFVILTYIQLHFLFAPNG